MNNEDTSGIDLIVHPIGVGMFREEQFEEWINEAKKIAIKYKTMIIGTSHADGSFRESDVSIPIAYSATKKNRTVITYSHNIYIWNREPLDSVTNTEG